MDDVDSSKVECKYENKEDIQVIGANNRKIKPKIPGESFVSNEENGNRTRQEENIRIPSPANNNKIHHKFGEGQPNQPGPVQQNQNIGQRPRHYANVNINTFGLWFAIVIAILGFSIYPIYWNAQNVLLSCKNETIIVYQNQDSRKYIHINGIEPYHPSTAHYTFIIDRKKSEPKLIRIFGPEKKKIKKKYFNMTIPTKFKSYGNIYIKLIIEHLFMGKFPLKSECTKTVEVRQFKIFGIDLGTTYSSIGIHELGLSVLQNPNYEKNQARATTFFNLTQKDEKSIPSAVYFDTCTQGICVYVGFEAQLKIMKDPINGLYDVKRIIGRKKGEKQIDIWIERHKHKLRYDNNGNIEVFIPNIGDWITLEQVSGVILCYLVNEASAMNGFLYNKHVIISIPAYFHNGQRKGTIMAANLVDLNVTKLIPEPSSAAIAAVYTKQLTTKAARLFVTFDWGGGTLDINVLECILFPQIRCDVAAVEGDSALGGNDFDYIVLDIIKSKYPDIPEKYLTRHVGEEIKIKLSKQKIPVKYPLKYNNNIKYVTINRSEFNTHNKTIELIDRALSLADKAFKEGLKYYKTKDVIDNFQMQKNKIKAILLVGGTCLIPIVKSKIEEHYQHKKKKNAIFIPKKEIFIPKNSQLMVVEGATVAAGSIEFDSATSDNRVLTGDVIPLDIGVAIGDASDPSMDIWVKKNTKYPTTVVKTYCQPKGWDSVMLSLYEGEHKKVKNNILIIEREIYDIPERKDDCDTLTITFEINGDGIAKIIVEIKNGETILLEPGITHSIDPTRDNGKFLKRKEQLQSWYMYTKNGTFSKIKDILQDKEYFKTHPPRKA